MAIRPSKRRKWPLARAIGEAAKGIEDLHTQDQEGNVIDKPAEDEPVAEDEDKDAAIRRILDDMVEKGLKPEDARSFLGALKDLAYNPDEAQDGDEDMAEGADDELEQADGAEPDDCEQIVQDGLKACGYDAEPEELQALLLRASATAKRRRRPSLRSSTASTSAKAKSATPRVRPSASSAAS